VKAHQYILSQSLSGELIEKMECLKHWLTKKVLDNVHIEVGEYILAEGDDEVEYKEDLYR